MWSPYSTTWWEWGLCPWTLTAFFIVLTVFSLLKWRKANSSIFQVFINTTLWFLFWVLYTPVCTVSVSSSSIVVTKIGIEMRSLIYEINEPLSVFLTDRKESLCKTLAVHQMARPWHSCLSRFFHQICPLCEEEPHYRTPPCPLQCWCRPNRGVHMCGCCVLYHREELLSKCVIKQVNWQCL